MRVHPLLFSLSSFVLPPRQLLILVPFRLSSSRCSLAMVSVPSKRLNNTRGDSSCPQQVDGNALSARTHLFSSSSTLVLRSVRWRWRRSDLTRLILFSDSSRGDATPLSYSSPFATCRRASPISRQQLLRIKHPARCTGRHRSCGRTGTLASPTRTNNPLFPTYPSSVPLAPAAISASLAVPTHAQPRAPRSHEGVRVFETPKDGRAVWALRTLERRPTP